MKGARSHVACERWAQTYTCFKFNLISNNYEEVFSCQSINV